MGIVPGQFTGIAPNARFLCYRAEDELSEYYGEEDFVAAVRAGTRLLMYVGHGHEEVWSDSRFLTVEDVPTLPASGNPSLVVGLTSSQAFDDHGSETLVRELILLDSGGSVASVASSGVPTGR